MSSGLTVRWVAASDAGFTNAPRARNAGSEKEINLGVKARTSAREATPRRLDRLAPVKEVAQIGAVNRARVFVRLAGSRGDKGLDRTGTTAVAFSSIVTGSEGRPAARSRRGVPGMPVAASSCGSGDANADQPPLSARKAQV